MATEVALPHLPCLVHVSKTLQEQFWVGKSHSCCWFCCLPLQRIQGALMRGPAGSAFASHCADPGPTLPPAQAVITSPALPPPRGESHRLFCLCSPPSQHSHRPVPHPCRALRGAWAQLPAQPSAHSHKKGPLDLAAAPELRTLTAWRDPQAAAAQLRRGSRRHSVDGSIGS